MLMVVEENLSPEEKLLKAVEQGSAQKAETAAANPRPDHGEGAPPKGNPFESFFKGTGLALKKMGEGWEMKLHELKEKGTLPPFVKWPLFPQWRLDLRTANHLLTGLVVLLFFFLIGDIIFYQPKVLLDFEISGPASLPDVLLGQSEKAKTLDHYTELAAARNLFQPYVPRPAPVPQEAAGAVATPSTAPTTLKLVAVAETEGGFEAIVEDEEKKESHFFKKGDKFGDYKVESVSWDRVVFSRGSDQWELK